jgi:hypothetical protein
LYHYGTSNFNLKKGDSMTSIKSVLKNKWNSQLNTIEVSVWIKEINESIELDFTIELKSNRIYIIGCTVTNDIIDTLKFIDEKSMIVGVTDCLKKALSSTSKCHIESLTNAEYGYFKYPCRFQFIKGVNIDIFDADMYIYPDGF